LLPLVGASILILHMNYRTLSVNKMNDNNESTKGTVPTPTPLLKII
jgi:hypothetical protein